MSQRARNVRLAVVLGLAALAVYLAFVLLLLQEGGA
jgi:hypothetical protein